MNLFAAIASNIDVVFQPITIFDFFKRLCPTPDFIIFMFVGKFAYSDLLFFCPVLTFIIIKILGFFKANFLKFLKLKNVNFSNYISYYILIYI